MPRCLRLLQKAARPLGGALERIVTGGVTDGVTLAVPWFTSQVVKRVVVDLVAHRARGRAHR